MPAPIPIELRLRVVALYNEGLGTQEELGKRFCVSASAICNWLKLDALYNDISPSLSKRGRKPSITDDDLSKLRKLVSEKPDRTVSELTYSWNKLYRSNISRSVIGRALLRANLPFKKRHSAPLSVIEKMLSEKKRTSWKK